MKQCHTEDMFGAICIHVAGHTCDHRFAQWGEGDLSHEIRLQYAKDVRDRENAKMKRVYDAAMAWRAAGGDRHLRHHECLNQQPCTDCALVDAIVSAVDADACGVTT